MTSGPASFPRAVLFPVFVLSGISALIYQLVWQRLPARAFTLGTVPPSM